MMTRKQQHESSTEPSGDALHRTAVSDISLLRPRLFSACGLLLLLGFSSVCLAAYFSYRAEEASQCAGRHCDDEPRWWSEPVPAAVAAAARGVVERARDSEAAGGRPASPLFRALRAAETAAPHATPTTADTSSSSSWCPTCECPCDAGPYVYHSWCNGRARDGRDMLQEGIGGRMHHMRVATTVARMTNNTLIIDAECLRDGHHHADLDTRLGIGRSAECDSCSLSRRAAFHVSDGDVREQLEVDKMINVTCPVLTAADKVALLGDHRDAINSSWFSPALLSAVYKTVAQLNSSALTRAVFNFTQHRILQALGACTADLYHARYEAHFRRQTSAGSRPPLPFDPAVFSIAVHFRWGDVDTGDMTRVTRRTGYTLATFADLTQRVVSMPELRGRSRVWLFSEGETGQFASFLQPANGSGLCSLSAISTLRLGENSSSAASSSWDDLDMMAHADVLIGGRSSFFALAAELAGRQQLVLASDDSPKLADHGTGFFAPRLQAVKPFDEELFRQRLLASAAYARVSALTADAAAASVKRGGSEPPHAADCASSPLRAR